MTSVRVRLVLNLYIAVVVTVLGALILENVGTNSDQNRQIAEQARQLSRTTQQASLAGCRRGNFIRQKINTVSGAVRRLLARSVQENEARGRELTPDQRAFLAGLHKDLAPLDRINCQEAYSR